MTRWKNDSQRKAIFANLQRNRPKDRLGRTVSLRGYAASLSRSARRPRTSCLGEPRVVFLSPNDFYSKYSKYEDYLEQAKAFYAYGPRTAYVNMGAITGKTKKDRVQDLAYTLAHEQGHHLQGTDESRADQFAFNILKGGKADNLPASFFDPKKLAEGMIVEAEHTKDPRVASEIAMDHLAEDPGYYAKLKRARL